MPAALLLLALAAPAHPRRLYLAEGWRLRGGTALIDASIADPPWNDGLLSRSTMFWVVPALSFGLERVTTLPQNRFQRYLGVELTLPYAPSWPSRVRDCPSPGEPCDNRGWSSQRDSYAGAWISVLGSWRHATPSGRFAPGVGLSATVALVDARADGLLRHAGWRAAPLLGSFFELPTFFRSVEVTSRLGFLFNPLDGTLSIQASFSYATWLRTECYWSDK